MSSKLNYKQVANVERRTWDEEAYEAKARERAAREKSSNSVAGKKRPLPSSTESASETKSSSVLDALKEETIAEEFQPALKGAAGPLHSKRAFVKARKQKLNLDAKVGSSEIVNADLAAASSLKDDNDIGITDGVTKLVSGVGWHCRVCDCFLKDSLTYLDHINGRKHQRNLGYSMRIENSTTDQVVGRLEMLARKRQADREQREKERLDGLGGDADVENIFDNMVKQKDDEVKRRKAERKKRREERKRREREGKQKQTVSQETEENHQNEGKTPKEDDNKNEQENEEFEVEEINPDMASMMGFSSFG